MNLLMEWDLPSRSDWLEWLKEAATHTLVHVVHAPPWLQISKRREHCVSIAVSGL